MTDAGHLKSSVKLGKNKLIIHLDPGMWKYYWNEQSINQRYYQCLLRVWKTNRIFEYTIPTPKYQLFNMDIEHDSALRGNKIKF